MKKAIVLFLAVLFLTACSSKKKVAENNYSSLSEKEIALRDSATRAYIATHSFITSDKRFATKTKAPSRDLELGKMAGEIIKTALGK